MSLDIHLFVHYPPDKAVLEKLDALTEIVKGMRDDPKLLASLAARVADADLKLSTTIDLNTPKEEPKP